MTNIIKNILIVVLSIGFLLQLMRELGWIGDSNEQYRHPEVCYPDTIPSQAPHDTPLETVPEIIVLNPTELCW